MLSSIDSSVSSPLLTPEPSSPKSSSPPLATAHRPEHPHLHQVHPFHLIQYH